MPVHVMVSSTTFRGFPFPWVVMRLRDGDVHDVVWFVDICDACRERFTTQQRDLQRFTAHLRRLKLIHDAVHADVSSFTTRSFGRGHVASLRFRSAPRMRSMLSMVR